MKTKQNIQSYFRTKLSRSISSPSKAKGPKRPDVLSEDELHCLWEEVESKFDDMPEAKRIAAFRNFWEMDYEATKLDRKTNCFYRSAPLMRAFTICHDELAQGYFRFKGEKLSTQQDIAVAVQTVKNSIKSTIRRHKGIARKSDDPLPQAPEFGESTWIFQGFKEGFGSDNHLIGFFFSEASRNQAIEEVLMEWGQYGVRTEPVHNERLVENERQAFWQNDFDRKGFRKQFAKLSHDDRLTAIEDLASKEIDLKYTDRKTGFVYASNGVVFVDGGIELRYDKSKNWRIFTYPLALGYTEASLPSPSEQFYEIDRVERALLGIIAKHSGYLVNISRSLPKEYLGSGHIDARFPNEATRRSASKEVFEKLSVYGVHFDTDRGEELSIDEQIAEAYQELDSFRREIDSDWKGFNSWKDRHHERKIQIEEFEAEGVESWKEAWTELVSKGIFRSENNIGDRFTEALESRKERHSEEEGRINEMESMILEREEEFKEFAQKIAERVRGLSSERMNSNDGDSMSEE